MKPSKAFVTGIALIAAAGGGLYYFHPELLRQWLPASWCDALHVAKQVPGSYIGKTLKGEEWTNVDAIQDKLRNMIDRRLTGTSPQQVKAFMQEPENRLILAQYTLAQASKDTEKKRIDQEQTRNKDLENLKKQLADQEKMLPQGAELSPKQQARQKKLRSRIAAIEKENAAVHDVQQFASTKEGRELMEKLSNNLDWTEQINSTGEKSNPGEVASILQQIAAKNPDMIYNQMDRDIATATATEFSRSGWAQQDAADRSAFFTKNWKSGKLNSSFGSLPHWQKRIVLGLKGKGEVAGAGGNDMAGSIDSLTYSTQNVHLPAYRYTGSCWQAPYRLHNIYGESIHGSGYHETFVDNYGRNFNELTRTVGGVCGGLSHYGATTATANGIPALTAGEPGHCAYIVLVGDKWTPAYSLSWERGLHWQVFQGNNKYSALHMATKLFSPEEKEKTDLSRAMQNLGNMYASSDPDKARTLFSNSVAAQPANYYAWRDYARFLTEKEPENATAWTALCEQLNNTLAPAYGEMTAELLKSEVYPGLKKALAKNPEELKRVVLGFWSNLKGMGPDEDWDRGNHGRWNVEELCRAQMNILGINPQKDPAVKDFFRTVMTSVSSNQEYAPVVLSWGNSLVEKMEPALKPGFMEAMLSSISKDGDNAAGDREKMLIPVILAAEKTGDIKSFQAIGKTLPEKYHKPQAKLPKFDPFPEKLVSQGGLIQASSTSNFDKPCEHWGVLEPGVGGSFHTAKDKDAWVKITLPKQANLTGIVLITTTGNLNRHDNIKVQVSETGNDKDWKDVATLGKCTQQVLRIDLDTSRPLAKYVRILRQGGPDFFHLRGIYIYGKPAA